MPEGKATAKTSDCDGGNHATSELKSSRIPLSDSKLTVPFELALCQGAEQTQGQRELQLAAQSGVYC